MAAATFPALRPDDDAGEFSSCWSSRGNEMGNLRIASLVMAVGVRQRNVSISMPCVARGEMPGRTV